MMLNDTNDEGLSLKLYRSTSRGITEPAILDRDDDYQAVLLDQLLLTLNSDEKNLPVLPGSIQTIELSGRKAYWIPISHLAQKMFFQKSVFLNNDTAVLASLE